MTLLADLRHAALHETGHAYVAAFLGIEGEVRISISEKGVQGAFAIAAGQALDQVAREMLAIGGAVAEALHDEPQITLTQLARRLERRSGGISSADAELCGGSISSDALDGVLSLFRRDWDAVLRIAEQHVNAFGVSW